MTVENSQHPRFYQYGSTEQFKAQSCRGGRQDKHHAVNRLFQVPLSLSYTHPSWLDRDLREVLYHRTYLLRYLAISSSSTCCDTKKSERKPIQAFHLQISYSLGEACKSLVKLVFIHRQSQFGQDGQSSLISITVLTNRLYSRVLSKWRTRTPTCPQPRRIESRLEAQFKMRPVWALSCTEVLNLVTCKSPSFIHVPSWHPTKLTTNDATGR